MHFLNIHHKNYQRVCLKTKRKGGSKAVFTLCKNSSVRSRASLDLSPKSLFWLIPQESHSQAGLLATLNTEYVKTNRDSKTGWPSRAQLLEFSSGFLLDFAAVVQYCFVQQLLNQTFDKKTSWPILLLLHLVNFKLNSTFESTKETFVFCI